MEKFFTDLLYFVKYWEKYFYVKKNVKQNIFTHPPWAPLLLSAPLHLVP